MANLRFKVGDTARVVVSRGAHSQKHLNDVVEIGRVGKDGDIDFYGQPYDYVTSCNCDVGIGERGCALMDYQLQPINPPPEPESLKRTSEEEIEA